MSMCLLLVPASTLIFVLLIVPLIRMDTMMIVFNTILIVTAIICHHVLNWCRRKYPNAFNSLILPTISDLKGADNSEDDYVARSQLLGSIE